MTRPINAIAIALFLALGLGSIATPSAQGAEASKAPKKATLKHVAPLAGAELLANKAVGVLDIRTAKEFASGYIGGATNLDFNGRDFEQQLSGLDKSKTYLIYCASGRRGTKSLATFEKLGFVSIVHLDGGIAAWKAAGQPVQKK